jgi:hypothetical protein
MKTKMLLFILLSDIISISCNKDITQQNDNFPDNLGYQWTYRLTSGSIDTVNVEIVGQGILPNGISAKIWKYTYRYISRTYVDTVWVSYIDNDVRIYDNPCRICTNQMPFERLHYILPLRAGKFWYTNAPYGDTTKVLDQESIAVPAGTFLNVFRLSKHRGYVTNSWTNDTIYFKEQVGLVKLNQNEFNLGPVTGNGIWELINYNFEQK